tara:strand:- start:54 stop:1262 length:1209 start_codon:yes stop_codon:yes gene_type:complete
MGKFWKFVVVLFVILITILVASFFVSNQLNKKIVEYETVLEEGLERTDKSWGVLFINEEKINKDIADQLKNEYIKLIEVTKEYRNFLIKNNLEEKKLKSDLIIEELKLRNQLLLKLIDWFKVIEEIDSLDQPSATSFDINDFIDELNINSQSALDVAQSHKSFLIENEDKFREIGIDAVKKRLDVQKTITIVEDLTEDAKKIKELIPIYDPINDTIEAWFQWSKKYDKIRDRLDYTIEQYNEANLKSYLYYTVTSISILEDIENELLNVKFLLEEESSLIHQFSKTTLKLDGQAKEYATSALRYIKLANTHTTKEIVTFESGIDLYKSFNKQRKVRESAINYRLDQSNSHMEKADEYIENATNEIDKLLALQDTKGSPKALRLQLPIQINKGSSRFLLNTDL